MKVRTFLLIIGALMCVFTFWALLRSISRIKTLAYSEASVSSRCESWTKQKSMASPDGSTYVRERDGFAAVGQARYVATQFYQNRRGRDLVYVDVGALDGVKESMSRYFDACLSWRGVCVEPQPDQFAKLAASERSCDVIRACCSNKPGIDQEFLVVGSGFLSGLPSHFEQADWARVEAEKSHRINVTCVRLQSILDFFDIQHIDVLIVDAEGAELVVLGSIDVSKVVVDTLIVENNWESDESREKIARMFGVEFFAYIGVDDIFRRRESAEL